MPCPRWPRLTRACGRPRRRCAGSTTRANARRSPFSLRAPIRQCWPRRRATTSTAARRSSTSTWAVRRRRSATSPAALRCCVIWIWSARIFDAVVGAVDVPVTLKYRTGWDPQQRNAVAVARLAEQRGIAALTLHGRTRACGFGGEAEFETIRAVKRAVALPVVANGDIDSPAKALAVLRYTGADAVMIGRAAQGRPWIFREIAHFLDHRRIAAAAAGRRSAPAAAVASRRSLSFLWHGGRRAHRAQAHHLVHARPGRAATTSATEMNRLDDCLAQQRAVDGFLRRHARTS